MSPELQALLLVTIPLALGGLALAIVKGVEKIVRSQFDLVERFNTALADNSQAAVDRENNYNEVFDEFRENVKELRLEVKSLQGELKEKETKIQMRETK